MCVGEESGNYIHCNCCLYFYERNIEISWDDKMAESSWMEILVMAT